MPHDGLEDWTTTATTTVITIIIIFIKTFSSLWESYLHTVFH